MEPAPRSPNPAIRRPAVMYVGAAIRERATPQGADQIVGMLSVGKPVAAFSPFIANARQNLLAAGAVSAGAFALLLLIVTVWLVRPFGLVTDLWRAVRSKRGGAGRVLNPFRVAFADIRDALTGKSYVEEYVATLTHEIKSPLAAIRGAAELLREPLPENARVRFTDNIEEQVARAQDMVDRMLELSSLERRAIVAQHERLSVATLADAVRAELAPVAAQRGVELFIDVDPELEISGDRFLSATCAIQPGQQRDRLRAGRNRSHRRRATGARSHRNHGARSWRRPAAVRQRARIRKVLLDAAAER